VDRRSMVERAARTTGRGRGEDARMSSGAGSARVSGRFIDREGDVERRSKWTGRSDLPPGLPAKHGIDPTPQAENRPARPRPRAPATRSDSARSTLDWPTVPTRPPSVIWRPAAPRPPSETVEPFHANGVGPVIASHEPGQPSRVTTMPGVIAVVHPIRACPGVVDGGSR
jgi:hypothetical protein